MPETRWRRCPLGSETKCEVCGSRPAVILGIALSASLLRRVMYLPSLSDDGFSAPSVNYVNYSFQSLPSTLTPPILVSMYDVWVSAER